MDCYRISPVSNIAPGRTYDAAMLASKQQQAPMYSKAWYRATRKLVDLTHEAHCSIVISLRGRLLQATRAHDDAEIEKISQLIENHVQTKHLARFTRSWDKG